MQNSLLEQTDLPLFSQIKPADVEPALDYLLKNARSAVELSLRGITEYTWDNLIAPIESAENRLKKSWSPISHLNAVMNSPELREAYNACLPKLSDYTTEMGQHEGLFNAYKAIASASSFATLDIAQQQVVLNGLRDFKLSGVDLPCDKKLRYKDINQRLSQLVSRFEDNVLDATNDWKKYITDLNDLIGLPETALAQAKQSAEMFHVEQMARQVSEKEAPMFHVEQLRNTDDIGWLITLQYPSYIAVMTYADNRALRYEVYEAFSTRASKGEWDNTQIMEEILSLRHELAQLVGFDNYAQLSLATKMATSTDAVVAFLEDLAKKAWPQALQDMIELRQFASDYLDIEELQAWDIAYVSEKLRQKRYSLSQEELKSYFPSQHVLQGLFAIAQRLFGLTIEPVAEYERWHEDVRLYEIKDKNNYQRGRFYLDLYARAKKRGGAWMDDCMGRHQLEKGIIQYPVAYLICNFTPPTNEMPSLLTHDDVTTLFHEFGHTLHHVLTQVNYLAVSGINGVAWDAVELPSQFMENWCWDKDVLKLLSSHYKTGESLPDALFEKMYAAKNFQAGMLMIRQLEFSLFDFYIHRDYAPALGGRIYETLNSIRQRISVAPTPAFNRFAHSFSHIFAGGYAAGYYSYKWAEVLSSDAFSLFEEKGIFDAQTGQLFLQTILEKGGSKDAMQLFKDFRGREPNIDALLRHNGIQSL
jgi:oligopeptidase A